MSRNDIIRIAREAGLHIATDVSWMPIIGLKYAEKFAALVASAERERFADECIDLVASYGGPVDLEAAIRARGYKND